MTIDAKTSIRDAVRDYYGTTLKSSADLATDACCTIDDAPAFLRALTANVHPDVTSKYYGCGLIAPTALDGARVLDLGCGAGQDAFVLAQLVGPTGSVVGVDMTPEQLAVARTHEVWHAERFGYAAANTTFMEGDIEKLGALGLAPGSFDVIVSNCVINLCTDKKAVFEAAFDLLKPGGEMYFSDVYADRRVPEALREHPKARGECLSGALYWNDFLALAKDAGFRDPRLVTHRPLAVGAADLKALLAPTTFHSATYRLFKIDGLEPACEDYGQAVVYRGGIAHAEDVFALDAHHVIERGRVFPVCGNTWRMLAQSRFADAFDFIGDFSRHFGIFPGCGTISPFTDDVADGLSGCC
ncbi:MAG: methyltransferase domain-containing protein [Pseudomonadota bacterium]